jgi:DNA-binding NtrC family response regulator
MQTILLVAWDAEARDGASRVLREAGYGVEVVEDAFQAMVALGSRRYGLLISGDNPPGMTGLELLAKAAEHYVATGVFLIAERPDVALAVQAMRLGAFDVLTRPFPEETLLLAVERYFHLRKLRHDSLNLSSWKGLEDMIGGLSVQPVIDRIQALADTGIPVLIQGESGTGKELVADALHHLSSRRGKPLVKINCAALPEQLLESELFGHVKGAFTGAHRTRQGKFESANGGTLFFDEAGEMSLLMQVKLLRVLEEGVITRVGGNAPIPVDVRAIFATSRDIEAMVAAGEFRSELYYRINVVPILLPRLQDRGDDIALLLQHFLNIYREQFGRGQLTLSQRARSALLAYDYPGNIRELRNILQGAVLLAENGVVRLGHLPQRVRQTVLAQESGETGEERPGLAEGVRRYERDRILQALEHTGGRKCEAATWLGVTRKVLWKKMRDLGIRA